MTFKRTGRRKTPRSAHESPFNARPRAGATLTSEPALHPRIAGREVPAAPEWMAKPLRPLGGMVKR